MLVSEPFEIYKPDIYYKSYDIFHFDPTLVLFRTALPGAEYNDPFDRFFEEFLNVTVA